MTGVKPKLGEMVVENTQLSAICQDIFASSCFGPTHRSPWLWRRIHRRRVSMHRTNRPELLRLINFVDTAASYLHSEPAEVGQTDRSK